MLETVSSGVALLVELPLMHGRAYMMDGRLMRSLTWAGFNPVTDTNA